MLLEANRDVAGMRTRIDLERVRDAVPIHRVVQFPGVDPQSILIADVDRDRPVSLQSRDVLIDERQRRVRGPFREDP